MMLHLFKIGLVCKNPTCTPEEQTAIIKECPLYRPPNGIHSLIGADAYAATHEWLHSKFPEI